MAKVFCGAGGKIFKTQRNVEQERIHREFETYTQQRLEEEAREMRERLEGCFLPE